MFGVAEDHDSNPIKIGLGKLKARGAKIVSVNPVRTGYSAIADEWIGIRPGTDGLFVLRADPRTAARRRASISTISCATPMRAGSSSQIPGAADDGLFARDADGEPLVLRPARAAPRRRRTRPTSRRRIVGEFAAADGRRAVPVFQLLAERYLDRAIRAGGGRRGLRHRRRRPSAASPPRSPTSRSSRRSSSTCPGPTGPGGATSKMIGRPVAMHAMRGISAHSNGFHTCRAIHLLQMLLGAIECARRLPLQAAVPEAGPARRRSPRGKRDRAPSTPLAGTPLGFPPAPEDLLVDADGTPRRIDKAFSWEAPLAAHGLMHMVIPNAWAGDPYPIDTLFLYMANMSWNSAMNTARTMRDADRQATRRAASTRSRTSSIPTPTPRRWWPTPIWCCPTRPISSAGIASRCSTGRSATPTARPTRSASRSWRPTATCGRSRTCCIDLGARLELPGIVTRGRLAAISRRLSPITSSITSARPASARSPAGAARTASTHGIGAANPQAARRLHRQRMFLAHRARAG